MLSPDFETLLQKHGYATYAPSAQQAAQPQQQYSSGPPTRSAQVANTASNVLRAANTAGAVVSTAQKSVDRAAKKKRNRSGRIAAKGSAKAAWSKAKEDGKGTYGRITGALGGAYKGRANARAALPKTRTLTDAASRGVRRVKLNTKKFFR